jgi:HEAT repeat protein
MAIDNQTTAKLLTDLKSENPEIRRKAVEFLGRFKAVEAVPQLIATLLNANDSDEQQSIVQALAVIEDKRATQSIVLTMLNTTSKALQVTCANALGLLKDTSAIPFLFDLLTQPEYQQNVPARLEAVTAIFRIGDRNAAPELLKLLPGQPPVVQARLMKILASFKYGPALETITQYVDRTDIIQEGETEVKLGDAAFQALQILNPIYANQIRR